MRLRVAHLVALAAFLIAGILPGMLFAGGGPENLLLVVNRGSDSSKMIANHYIHLRDIPARNVVYLDNIPNQERISFREFEETILDPLVKTIKDRKLDGNIDYIVYSSDFPTAVTVRHERAKFNESAKDAPGGVQAVANSKLYVPEASITSLTYFVSSLINDDYSFFRLNSNPYARVQNPQLLSSPFYGEALEKHKSALQDIRERRIDEAIPVLEELAKQHPRQVAVTYWLARCHGIKGNVEESAKWLRQAIGGGWAYRDFTRSDLAFDPVVDDEKFKAVLDQMENQDFSYLPTRGFRSTYIWGPNGMINGTPDQGRPNILSTCLAVTRNKGMSEAEAIAYLETSVAADDTHPTGTVYFCSSADVRTKTRLPLFAGAIQELAGLGLGGEVIDGHFVKNKHDIVGLTMGRAVFDVSEWNSTIIPGAICENLTSYGGTMRPRTGHTKCTELLRHGAAGSSGTVCEPYAVVAKFPHPRIHCHYARGCSLAESFYQSVHGPFQLLIVGDALCQPWAVRPEFDVTGLESNAEVTGKVDLKFSYAEKVPVAGAEVYLDGKLLQRVRRPSRIVFDSSRFSDGYHELVFIAVADNIIETQARKVIPFTINNSGHSVTLTCELDQLNWDGSINLVAGSNCGDEIQLIQNHDVIAKGGQSEVIFKVSGRKLGRGPVTLRVVVEKDGKQISSVPLELTVNGLVATTKSETVELKR